MVNIILELVIFNVTRTIRTLSCDGEIVIVKFTVSVIIIVIVDSFNKRNGYCGFYLTFSRIFIPKKYNFYLISYGRIIVSHRGTVVLAGRALKRQIMIMIGIIRITYKQYTQPLIRSYKVGLLYGIIQQNNFDARTDRKVKNYSNSNSY